MTTEVEVIRQLSSELAELRTEIRVTKEQRGEMIVEMRELRGDLLKLQASLSSSVSAMRADHERLTNRGFGFLVGVGLAGGASGATIATALKSLFQG